MLCISQRIYRLLHQPQSHQYIVQGAAFRRQQHKYDRIYQNPGYEIGDGGTCLNHLGVTLIFQLGNGDGKNGGKHRAADIQEGNTQGIPHHIQEILGIGDNFLKVLQSDKF